MATKDDMAVIFVLWLSLIIVWLYFGPSLLIKIH